MSMKTQDMSNKADMLNEVVDINGSKVFIEDGEVKTVLSEQIQQNGYMSLEDARNILHAIIDKEYMLP